MSEQDFKDFNEQFAKRLRYYMDEYDLTQKDLAKRLGVGTSTVYSWVHCLKTPRMDKVDAMCRIFHCDRSDLIAPEQKPEYYLDDKVRETAEFLYSNPEYQILFDASRKTKKEDIDFVVQMLNKVNGDNE